LLHNNAPAHKAVFANFFTPPPLCSPALSLLDYFLFPKLKMKLKGLNLVDVAEILEAVTDELKKAQKE